jgi:hypothetical protein
MVYFDTLRDCIKEATVRSTWVGRGSVPTDTKIHPGDPAYLPANFFW